MIRVIFALLIICGITSCMPSKEDLRDSVDHYNNAIRWKNVDAAIGFVDPSKRMIYFQNAKKFFSSVNITNVEVDHVADLGGSTEGAKKDTEIDVYVTVDYFSDSSPSLKSAFFKQRWRYFSKYDTWLVDSETPVELAQTKTP